MQTTQSSFPARARTAWRRWRVSLPLVKRLSCCATTFSFRWTQIFEQCSIPSEHIVMKARPVAGQEGGVQAQFAPAPIEEVVATILQKARRRLRPQVETSTGIIIPDWYVKKVAEAVREVGGLMVLDCIASGTVWANMRELGIGTLIQRPRRLDWAGVCRAHHALRARRRVPRPLPLP